MRQRQFWQPVIITLTSADPSPHTAEAQKLGDLSPFPQSPGQGPGFCLVSSCLSPPPPAVLHRGPKPAKAASETCETWTKACSGHCFWSLSRLRFRSLP